jgi:hypothetical protein
MSVFLTRYWNQENIKYMSLSSHDGVCDETKSCGSPGGPGDDLGQGKGQVEARDDRRWRARRTDRVVGRSSRLRPFPPTGKRTTPSSRAGPRLDWDLREPLARASDHVLYSSSLAGRPLYMQHKTSTKNDLKDYYITKQRRCWWATFVHGTEPLDQQSTSGACS